MLRGGRLHIPPRRLWARHRAECPSPAGSPGKPQGPSGERWLRSRGLGYRLKSSKQLQIWLFWGNGCKHAGWWHGSPTPLKSTALQSGPLPEGSFLTAEGPSTPPYCFYFPRGLGPEDNSQTATSESTSRGPPPCHPCGLRTLLSTHAGRPIALCGVCKDAHCSVVCETAKSVNRHKGPGRLCECGISPQHRPSCRV